MKELIKNIILNSETDVSFIGDAYEVADVVIELMRDGLEFMETDFNLVEEMREENDILSIAKNVYDDGEVEYFIQEVFADDGSTLQDDLSTIFMDSDLIDCVDLNAFNGEIICVEYDYKDEEYCDCEDYCDCDEELEEYEYDEELTFEEELEELLQDTLEDIENAECDCDECIYEKIIDMLVSAYYMGVEDAEY